MLVELCVPGREKRSPEKDSVCPAAVAGVPRGRGRTFPLFPPAAKREIMLAPVTVAYSPKRSPKENLSPGFSHLLSKAEGSPTR